MTAVIVKNSEPKRWCGQMLSENGQLRLIVMCLICWSVKYGPRR